MRLAGARRCAQLGDLCLVADVARDHGDLGTTDRPDLAYPVCGGRTLAGPAEQRDPFRACTSEVLAEFQAELAGAAGDDDMGQVRADRLVGCGCSLDEPLHVDLPAAQRQLGLCRSVQRRHDGRRLFRLLADPAIDRGAGKQCPGIRFRCTGTPHSPNR